MAKCGGCALVHCSVVWFVFHACFEGSFCVCFFFFQLKFRCAQMNSCSSVRSLMPYSPSSLSQQKKKVLLFWKIKNVALTFISHNRAEENHSVCVYHFYWGWGRGNSKLQTKMLHLMRELPECTKQLDFLIFFKNDVADVEQCCHRSF